MRVLVTAKLSDEKLLSKLVGIQACSDISRILIVRRTPIKGAKISSICPSGAFAHFTILYELWRLATLVRLLRRPDVHYVVGIQFFLHGLSAILSALLTGSKAVVWLIGSDVMIHGQKGAKGLLFRWMIGKADKVLVMGQAMKEKLLHLPDPKVVEMQSFIDPRRFIDSGTFNKKWDICFVGNLEEVKAVPRLIFAVKELVRGQCKNYSVVIVGGGSQYSKLQGLVRDEGLHDNVTFVGRQSSPIEYMLSSKVLVLTSKSEGLPAVLLESSFLGIPALTTDVGEIREVFDGYKHVAIFPDNDPNSIAFEIERVLGLVSDPSSLALLESDAKRFRESYLELWGKGPLSSKWADIFELHY